MFTHVPRASVVLAITCAILAPLTRCTGQELVERWSGSLPTDQAERHLWRAELSASGKYVKCEIWDGSAQVIVLDAADGSELTNLRGRLNGGLFDKRTEQLLTLTDDGLVSAYDLPSGKCVRTYRIAQGIAAPLQLATPADDMHIYGLANGITQIVRCREGDKEVDVLFDYTKHRSDLPFTIRPSYIDIIYSDGSNLYVLIHSRLLGIGLADRATAS